MFLLRTTGIVKFALLTALFNNSSSAEDLGSLTFERVPGPTHGNSCLEPGPSGSWYSQYVSAPTVLYDGETYRMWFVGSQTTEDNSFPYKTIERIGLATSRDGLHWQVAAAGKPVLDLGPPGSPDAKGLCHPYVMHVDGKYMMWYAAIDGSTGPNTHVRIERVALATSDDGIHWEKYRGAEPVMDIGLPGSLDAIQADGMSILRIDDQFVMWYAGYAGVDHGAHRLGIATSPDGMHWTKGYRSNRGQPLAGLAGKQQLGPSVYFDGENYLMLYNTHWQGGWATFLATSRDGVHWGGGSGDQRILPESPAGNFDTAGRGRNYSGSPSRLIPVGDRFRVWYGAEDGSPPHSVCIGLMETEEF
jgi:hypothetical protein